MTDTYAMDLRAFPREPVEVKEVEAMPSKTLQLWHERLGHQDNHNVLKVLDGWKST